MKRLRFAIQIATLLLAGLACGPSVVLFATPPTAPPVDAEPTLPPTSAPLPTLIPSRTPVPRTPLPSPTPGYPWVTHDLRIFPGPLHYEGDLLTFEVAVVNLRSIPESQIPVLIIDGEDTHAASSRIFHPLLDDFYQFSGAWDSTGKAGTHELVVKVPTGHDNTYTTTTRLFEILPADQRPAQERGAQWQQMTTDCCRLYYLSGTAAARDIDQIAATAERAIDGVEARFPGSEVRPFPIVLIDNMWGNGAYATGNEIVISYVDRAYNGLEMEPLIYHEATHYATFPLVHQTPSILVEGIAVYVTGGHYKVEPIRERAAALRALDMYIPLTDLTEHFRDRQHEIAYLEGAALVAYLDETYGWDIFLEIYAQDIPGSYDSTWLDSALRRVTGDSLDDVEQGFLAWLDATDPGSQVDVLSLTITLFDTMRDYQFRYALYEQFPPIEEAVTFQRTYEFIREPTAPENLALEAMLVNAHAALKDGRYREAEALVEAVQAVLADNDFTRQPVRDYLLIAWLLEVQGYEVQAVHLDGDTAQVTVIRDWPTLETLELVRSGDEWVLVN